MCPATEHEMTDYRFQDIVSGPDENINLALAALLVAQDEYPDLDVDSYQQRVDAIAGRCSEQCGAHETVGERVSTLNKVLFNQLAFRGDLETFNDPRNSYLSDVLDRRLGIPISLSVLYMEVGRRLDVRIFGISFPGHFLVRVCDSGEDLVLDPFTGGAVLERRELLQRLAHFPAEQRLKWNMDELLQPASRREILARMLRNLKSIYLGHEDFHRALRIVNSMLQITPDAAMDIRDRAFIHDQLDHVHAAAEDYERYLMLAGDSDDASYVKERLGNLRRSVARLH